MNWSHSLNQIIHPDNTVRQKRLCSHWFHRIGDILPRAVCVWGYTRTLWEYQRERHWFGQKQTLQRWIPEVHWLKYILFGKAGMPKVLIVIITSSSSHGWSTLLALAEGGQSRHDDNTGTCQGLEVQFTCIAIRMQTPMTEEAQKVQILGLAQEGSRLPLTSWDLDYRYCTNMFCDHSIKVNV